MKEVQSAYNGYTGYMLTGEELKEMLKGRYLSAYRHHSTIIGIQIQDYLTHIGVEDSETYTIYVNEHFCKILNTKIRSNFSFFGHTGESNIKFNNSANKTELVNVCPVCGSKVALRESKFGFFLGCKAYPKCKFTQGIPIIGEYSRNN